MSIFSGFKRAGIANRKADEILYSVVAQELSEGIRHEGLWLMALERANGNTDLQTAEYIKLRIQSLRDDISIVTSVTSINSLEDYQRAASLAFGGNVDRVTALISSGASFNTFQKYFDTYTADQIRDLLNTPDSDESYPLHIAVKFGRIDITRWLLEHGAYTKCTNTWGSTPLDLAVKANNTDLIELLK